MQIIYLHNENTISDDWEPYTKTIYLKLLENTAKEEWWSPWQAAEVCVVQTIPDWHMHAYYTLAITMI